MKTTVSKSDFIAAFQTMGRSGNFSYAGLCALFDYFEEIDEDMELDVIAICCDYVEYKDLKALKADYPDIKNMSALEDYTTVIMIDDKSFIIQQF